MPYKNDVIGKEARRNNDRRKKLEAYERQGLCPLDPYDPYSELRCETCGKISGRQADKKYRHYPTCDRLKDDNNAIRRNT